MAFVLWVETRLGRAIAGIPPRRRVASGTVAGRRNSGSLLVVDPFANALIKDIERKRAAAQQFVVEGTYIELRAELILGVLAKLENFELSELVSESLRGPSDVAVNFGLNVGFIHGRVTMEVGHHLVAGPVPLVNAGIDD